MERRGIMVEVDRKDWYKFRVEVKQSLNQEQFKLLCELHSKYFNHKFFKPCTCNPKVIKEWIRDINKLYENK